MAAPTPTPRVAPTGIRLRNGFKSTITLAQDTNIELWEIEVGQPGMDGGDAINTDNMHNATYVTMAARAHKTLTPFTVKCAYDPIVWGSSSLLNAINREDTITNTFPDLSTLCYFGFVQKAEFDALVEGTMPTVSVTICPTNYDYTNKVEAGPVETDISGT